jgi:molybdenum cofactor biosynthesis protein B
VSIRIAVLTISDACSRGEREDRSGASIEAWAAELGHSIETREIVPDEAAQITTRLITWADQGIADVIITTGGTGLGPRDVTPEATAAAIERLVPGIPEAIRAAGLRHQPYATLSRGLAGARAETLIVNLPGSVGGVRDGLAVLAPLVEHVTALLHGHTEHPA